MSFYIKLSKLLLGPGSNASKALDKYETELKNNPEFKVLRDNIDKAQQDLEDTVKDYCKRWPDSPLCKDR